MSILGTIFGSSKSIEKSFELIDNAFYTNEEKAKQKVEILKASEPFKLAQRYLALMFGFNFTIAFLIALIFSILGRDIGPILKVVVAFNLGSIILAIVVFYFGGGTINSLREIKK